MHLGSAMTVNVSKVDTEYIDDVLVVGVPEAFTNSLLFVVWFLPRHALVHNSYFLTLIMFVCTLSLGKIYTI